jgi:phosphoethanolamine N-methyltransferase
MTSNSSSELHVSSKYASFQEFLDQHQYSKEGILSYEKIFGRNFVSTGGEKTTKEFCELLDIQKDQVALDICCGIGGGAFYISKTYGARVLGVDLSRNMLNIAEERKKEQNVENVTFQHADVTTVEFDSECFDIIYCRDSILHIKDKLTLFKNCLKWLKPGGKLLITDYCSKEGEWSQEYAEYVVSRGYYIVSVTEYAKLLEEAGFIHVQGLDKTDLFMDILKEELESILRRKEEFCEDGLSETNYQYIVEGWQKKILRTALGDQRWGLFLAEKDVK